MKINSPNSIQWCRTAWVIHTMNSSTELNLERRCNGCFDYINWHHSGATLPNRKIVLLLYATVMPLW